MGIDLDIDFGIPTTSATCKKAQTASPPKPLSIMSRVPYSAGDDTVIDLGNASSPKPYRVRLPKGNYTLYKNSSGENLGFERQITSDAKMVVYSPEKAAELGEDYETLEISPDDSVRKVPRKFLEITRNGKVSTFFETESVNIFINRETDELLVYDKGKNKLIPNDEARKQYEEKAAEAIRLLEQNSDGFFNATGGKQDLSKELKAFGRGNILVNRSRSDEGAAQYIHDPKDVRLDRVNYARLGGKFYLMPEREDMNSKISLYYNSYAAMSSSPLDIAATIIHELGHAQDKDAQDSVQEEADVERIARNFKAYVQNPTGFKYQDFNNDTVFLAFLNDYKKNGYAATSPGHGQ